MGRIKEVYIDLINQYGHVDDIPLDVNLSDYIAKKREDEEREEENCDK
jgi:hypothetical protein